MRRLRKGIAAVVVMAAVALGSPSALAQDLRKAPSPESSQGASEPEELAGPQEPAARVEIQPHARDDEIGARLADILRATGWFSREAVRVQDGVVFLEGRAQTEGHKKWAGDLARSTRDVAVVVNRMDVATPPVWDFQPAASSLRQLGRGVVRSLPVLAYSLFILAAAWLMARLTAPLMRRVLARRSLTPFLREVLARATALAVFIVGLYIVLRVAGLTTVAMTVVGGTGILGLILGIAFRGISERAFQTANISMPDEARELIFPRGVPVHILEGEQLLPRLEEEQRSAARGGPSDASDDEVSARAEAGLHSEAEEIETQARRSRTPEAGENLLQGAASGKP